MCNVNAGGNSAPMRKYSRTFQIFPTDTVYPCVCKSYRVKPGGHLSEE
jgi:hypothetical protein